MSHKGTIKVNVSSPYKELGTCTPFGFKRNKRKKIIDGEFVNIQDVVNLRKHNKKK